MRSFDFCPESPLVAPWTSLLSDTLTAAEP